jgi:hypothetical protein
MSFILRGKLPTLKMCDKCGEMREIEYALHHSTHIAIHRRGDSARHLCRACYEEEAR